MGISIVRRVRYHHRRIACLPEGPVVGPRHAGNPFPEGTALRGKLRVPAKRRQEPLDPRRLLPVADEGDEVGRRSSTPLGAGESGAAAVTAYSCVPSGLMV